MATYEKLTPIKVFSLLRIEALPKVQQTADDELVPNETRVKRRHIV